MKLYIPSNLDLGTKKHKEKYCYIITQLYYGRVFDKRRTKESFIPLSSKILHYMLSDYKECLKKLIENGIIETNNQYRVGEVSKGYRLTSAYADAKFKEVQISDKRIIRKEMEFRAKKKLEIKLNHHRYIFNCLQKITMDFDGARNLIEVSNLNEYQYNSYSISVDMIESKTWFQTIDDTSGRCHNNITNLSSQLRPFLRLDNKKLVEIDIANSQPFLFNILIHSYFSSPSFSLTGTTTILPYVTKSELNDLELYKELTSKGTFYEYLMDNLQINEDRSEFKVRFFQKVFYSKENEKRVTKERRHFRKLFPTVAKIVSHYKKDSYNFLAIALQKAEADLIIGKIIPRLAERNIFALTIHDSILTLLENAETVRTIMLDIFQRDLGFTPTIRIKG